MKKVEVKLLSRKEKIYAEENVSVIIHLNGGEQRKNKKRHRSDKIVTRLKTAYSTEKQRDEISAGLWSTMAITVTP